MSKKTKALTLMLVATGLAFSQERYRNPELVSKVEPVYSEEARAAHIEGAVKLSIIVRKDGTADVLKVVKSLDPGLDANAIAAVKQWRFRPGTDGDGESADHRAMIDVNFRLLNPPSPEKPKKAKRK